MVIKLPLKVNEILLKNQDIIRCRIKTLGISQVKISYPEIELNVYDVGGQRNERRKWINCFDNVNCVMFFIALSEYDMTCYEDNVTNRMDESLKIFQSICENPLFDDIPMIIYFNKNDLFKEKIKTVDFNVYDDSYTGGCDYDKALEHIKGLYLKLNKNQNRSVEIFVCSSVDPKEFEENYEKIKKCIQEYFINEKK